jgi:hypothetical protein
MRRFHRQTHQIIRMLVMVLLIGTAVAMRVSRVVVACDALRKETRTMRFSESLCPRLASAGAGLGRWLMWSAAVSALTIAGCGRSGSVTPLYPVEGQVLWNGKPLAGASLVFCPREQSAAKNGVSPRAHSDVNGRFRVSTYSAGDGAAEGQYAVVVRCTPVVDTGGGSAPGPNILPRKYARAESTDLQVTVAKGATVLPALDLKQ